LVGIACVGLTVPAALSAAEPATPTATRDAWTSSRVSGSPDPAPPYRVEPAFPRLKFEHPLDFASIPRGDRARGDNPAPGNDRVSGNAKPPSSNRLFVAEQGGRIFSFPNDPNADKPDLVVDLKQVHKDLSALYGFTFHPDFARNRFVYVCYVTQNDKPDGTIVSRFTMTGDEPGKLDPASEQILIRWWSGGHNGGCLKFGPDGYLYISSGDGGGPDPPDPLRAGQDVTRLLSAVLRIDVDHRDGDRPYRVPPDNPFVNVVGARPEIWAHGFRNPWRMSFDRVRGDLWVGDVGWQLWEMIYRVERGGNYGWSVTEGPQPVLPEQPRGPTPILPPTVSHPHSEAASITGGFVYHGDRLPELMGTYIYGDFQSGKIWGLRHDGKQVTSLRELANTPLQLVAFGEDRAGELYLLDYERTRQIHRLVRNPDDGRNADFPRRLSQTGLFASVKDQTPSPGVIPFSINAHQWADHTTSERWMAIPGTAPVQVHADGNWQFPDGTVLAKTVGIEMERGVPASRRRLETQILHREQESWRPYTYVWNDDQTDAELAGAAGSDRVLKIRDPQAPGGVREQTYRIASRAECQLCHNPWVEKKTTVYGVQSASPLAVSTAQLNRTPPGDPEENQLARLQRLGWFAGKLPEAKDDAVRFVDPYDASADLNRRVRSYLHVNCAHCHQRHAGGTAMIDLMFETKLDNARMVDVRPAQGSFGITHAKVIAPGDPFGSVLLYRLSKTGGGRMPRLGSEEVDEPAVRMIHDWIAQLPRGTPAAGTDPPDQHAALMAGLRAESPEARNEVIRAAVGSTRGALTLLQLLDRGELPADTRNAVVSIAAESPQAEVRDLFERFIPVARRQKRLGNAVNRTELLALPADAERGRQLFFRDGASSCKSCHRVHEVGANLGPDLSQIGKKYPPAELLTHLLEPSKLIDPKFILYTLETTDGRVLSGLVVERTEHEVVLRNAQNPALRFARNEIEQLTPQQKSMMPDLLLRDLSPQQAADLVAYLASLK
jgi:uncharacterized repeat protein (TIGR03806 family)